MGKDVTIKQLGVSKAEFVKILKDCAKKDICSHFGISERTLDRLIGDYCLKKKNFGPKNLPDETVNSIRSLYSTGDYTQKELADRFHVSQSLVCKIVNNQIHRHAFGLTIRGEAVYRLGYRHGDS